MAKIKIILADDDKLVRTGLKVMLNTFDDIEIIDVAANGKEAFMLCEQKQPDLVLMDIRMPEYDGVTGTKLIKEKYDDVKVLILTTFNDVEYIHEALKYGASGYLLKDSDCELIYDGIKSAIKGNIVVNPEVASMMISTNVSSNSKSDIESIKIKWELSEKEINIIQEVANGLSNKEISEKLYLSEGTIKNNISNILSKLALRDRTQLTIFAFKNNLVT